jgi:hypothetical protein
MAEIAQRWIFDAAGGRFTVSNDDKLGRHPFKATALTVPNGAEHAALMTGTVTVRDDLAEAHRLAWDHVASPGSWWTGAQRVELATTILTALFEPEPLAPWVGPSVVDRLDADAVAPAAAHDFVYRLARHAGTITDDVHRSVADEVGELAFVELCALTSTVAAVAHFHRNVGLAVPPLPSPVEGEPTGLVADEVVEARLNWVPVAAPADQTAAVLQAYSAVPGEQANTWRMATAQYMPSHEMVHPDWSRSADGLSRSQMELVAARVAQLRECFY